MTFPREEKFDELIGDASYVEAGIRWRLFKDLTGGMQGMQILIVLGNQYTLLNGAQFRAIAERILRQLER